MSNETKNTLIIGLIFVIPSLLAGVYFGYTLALINFLDSPSKFASYAISCITRSYDLNKLDKVRKIADDKNN